MGQLAVELGAERLSAELEMVIHLEMVEGVEGLDLVDLRGHQVLAQRERMDIVAGKLERRAPRRVVKCKLSIRPRMHALDSGDVHLIRGLASMRGHEIVPRVAIVERLEGIATDIRLAHSIGAVRGEVLVSRGDVAEPNAARSEVLVLAATLPNVLPAEVRDCNLAA